MIVEKNYKIKINENEKQDILTFINKFADKNLPFNFSMENIMYDIFYHTNDFSYEFAKKYNIFPMLSYQINKHGEVNLSGDEMNDIIYILGNVRDIINNDGNSILPDFGLTGKDDALILFVQLLHGYSFNNKEIVESIEEITDEDILSDIEYFKSINNTLAECINILTNTDNVLYPIDIDICEKDKLSTKRFKEEVNHLFN